MVKEKRKYVHESGPNNGPIPEIQHNQNDPIPCMKKESFVLGLPEFFVGEDRDAKILTLLIDQSVDFRTVDATERTLLNIAAGSEENESILEASESRIKQITDEEERIQFVNHPDLSGFTPLYTAIIHLNDLFAAMLVRHGALYTYRVPSSLSLAKEKELPDKTSSTNENSPEDSIIQNATQSSGSLLFEAYHHKMYQTIKELGKRKAELTNEEWEFLQPTLNYALKEHDIETLKIFHWVVSGHTVYFQEEKMSILVYAFEENIDELFIGLVNEGAILDENEKKRIYEAGPMIFESIKRENPTLVKAVIKAGSGVDVKRGFNKDTPLHFAAAKGNLDIVNLLIESGADVNAMREGMFKQSVLHIAAIANNLSIVRHLIDAGADVTVVQGGGPGKTALVIASENQNLEMVKYLIKNGAPVDFPNQRKSALHIATEKMNLEMAKYLINAGADVDAKDKKNSKTALHYATQQYSLTMVEFLVHAGADVDAKDNEWKTALNYAVNGVWYEIAEFLVLAGADLNLKDDNNAIAKANVKTFMNDFEIV